MNPDQKDALVKALRFLEMMVVSLDRIGSQSASNQGDYAKSLERFISEYDVYAEAAEAREALSQFFDDDIPEGEEASEIEKLLADVRVWNAQ